MAYMFLAEILSGFGYNLFQRPNYNKSHNSDMFICNSQQEDYGKSF